MKYNFYYIFIVLFFLISCNSNSDEKNSNNFHNPDGNFCAEVNYHNPETGTRSTYTLDVEVRRERLVVIHWPRGGWIDRTRFRPQKIRRGTCSFTTYEGYENEVRLLEEGGCYEEDTTCPKCGEYMEEGASEC